ncbi:MAG: hypothetical protein ABIK28_21970 [Planctomycetota bacterium]
MCRRARRNSIPLEAATEEEKRRRYTFAELMRRVFRRGRSSLSSLSRQEGTRGDDQFGAGDPGDPRVSEAAGRSSG